MVNSRASTLESEPQVQHIEHLEDTPTPFSQAPRSFWPAVATKSSNASIPWSGTLPPVRPSRYNPYAQPATRTLNLTGFVCQPGHCDYGKAAKAAGVTDKSPVYWFHEDAYQSWEWDDMEYSAPKLLEAERTSNSEMCREMVHGHQDIGKEAKAKNATKEKNKRYSGAVVEGDDAVEVDTDEMRNWMRINGARNRSSME